MAKEYNDKGYHAGGMKPEVDMTEDLTGKFDCYGRSELAKQEERRREKFWKDSMKADVEARIERANNQNKIPQMAFHIASVNTWLELGNILCCLKNIMPFLIFSYSYFDLTSPNIRV